MSQPGRADGTRPGARPTSQPGDLDADDHGVTFQALTEAARLVDAAADDIEWTVVDSKDLAGMRRAADLLRMHARAYPTQPELPSRLAGGG